jgi:ribonuclease HII
MIVASMTTLLHRFAQDSLTEIGLDEAGRGSFWGPIMAGAVILPNEDTWTDSQRTLFALLRDSKKLTPLKRQKIEKQIHEHIPFYAVGIVEASEINDMGITWANREAFRRAVFALSVKAQLPVVEHPYRLLIDGTLPIDNWKGEQHVIVEGDNQYMAIAAASILAKVEHDRWITAYCAEHPECEERYHLVSSKGYGTAKHREGIRIYGGHELHRKIYIEEWLPGASQKSKRKYKHKTDGVTNKCLIQFQPPM